MRWVMARVLPVPAPASTHIGPLGCAATSRCSGSRASRTASAPGCTGRLVIGSILGACTDAGPRVPGRLWTAPGRFAGRAAFTTTEPARGTRQRTTMTGTTVSHLPAPGTVTMFTTTWCGYCRRLKSQMEREGIGFTEVDIEREPGTAEFVMSVNGGNQTVPTLLFHDGSAATNPTLAQVRARLA